MARSGVAKSKNAERQFPEQHVAAEITLPEKALPKRRPSFGQPEDVYGMFSKKLASSGLDMEDAKLLRITAHDLAEIRSLGLCKGRWAVPAMRFHYLAPDGKTAMEGEKGGTQYCRYRRLRDQPSWPEAPRYVQPSQSPVHAYFPRSVPWPSIVAEPSADLTITEGELKATKACKEGFPTIGLGGVDSFTRDKKLLPELAEIVWQGRKVLIGHDSDSATKPRVASAQQRLASALTALGAHVFAITLPPGPNGAKCGLDDLLCQPGGAAKLRALQAEAKPFNAHDPTEDGVALEFTDRYRDTLRYCHTTGAWFQWNGVVWQRDENKYVFSLVRQTCREIGAAAGKSKAQRERLARASTMAAVERLAMAGDAMGVTSSIWDADPFLLGTPGGTIDLKTGERYDAKPEDYITKLAAVAPTNEADCPLWLKFLTETTGGDAELIRFLQQWSGYTLTGDTREHQLLFIYGAGGNGKTVFINVLSGILHEYAKSAAMDTFTASRYAKHPTELAWLRGARLVTASETEDGHAWAEAKINLFTGGDQITARFMNKDFFEFWPVFKLTIVGNHKPELRNANDAAKRRHNIVPFNHKPISPDRQLEHKLHAEWPAILRWMIDGCLDWQRNGLVRPAIVTDATDEYFSVQDSFGSWMADCCVRDPKAKERPHVLLLNLNHWAEKNAEKQVTRKRFRNWVEQQEWLTYKTVRGADFVAGIRLLTDSELNQKNHEW